MAAAAAYPPWVIFDEYCTLGVQGCFTSIAEKNTMACCRTSTGHPIDVTLCLAAPPEGSRVCVHLPHGIMASYALVAAAHCDSVLIIVGQIEDHRIPTLFTTTADAETDDSSTDHFVYSAGDAAAEPPRPPSLSLLPPHYITYEDEEGRPGCRYLDNHSIGLLRRGDDFLVAKLQMEDVEERDDDDDKVHKEAALHLLRSGSGEWCVKRPVIVSGYTGDAGECVDDLVSSWRNSTVIAVGDQMLCWVDMVRGLLFCDNVFDESPSRLRYVPLPMEADLRQHSVCASAAADGRTIKVVNVFARCCCTGAGEFKCRGSHIHTWTLRMDDVDDMAWVMDGSLDSNQLWALDGYKGIPRVEFDSPVVCIDEPDAICFVVCEYHHDFHGDETVWRIMVDMKNKTLRSVFRCPEPEGRRRFTSYYDRYLPSRVSKYFNSNPSTGQPPGPLATQAPRQNLMSWIKNKLQQAINGITQAASPSPEATILTALQEIPSLDDRDELLKAYRILTDDDSGRRFRSLMALPMDLRKDWVLMEIKASEAFVFAPNAQQTCKLKNKHRRQQQ